MSDRIRKVYDDIYLNDLTGFNISKKYVSGKFLDRGKIYRLYKNNDWYYPEEGRVLLRYRCT